MSVNVTQLVVDLRSSSGFAISHPHLAHMVYASLDAAGVIERQQARIEALEARCKRLEVAGRDAAIGHVEACDCNLCRLVFTPESGS